MMLVVHRCRTRGRKPRGRTVMGHTRRGGQASIRPTDAGAGAGAGDSTDISKARAPVVMMGPVGFRVTSLHRTPTSSVSGLDRWIPFSQWVLPVPGGPRNTTL